MPAPIGLEIHSSESTQAVLIELAHVAESALLHEAMGRRGTLSPHIRPLSPDTKLIGRAFTVKAHPGDNLALHVAISLARPGDVLIVTMDGFLEAGAWGEITTVAAQMRKIAGLVIDGAVRDGRAIAALGFPVFSGGICSKGTTKRMKGLLNEPIIIAGVTVSRGDYVVGDSDGVTVIPAGEIRATIAAAHAIRRREAEIIRGLKRGELTLDLLGLRPAMKECGLRGRRKRLNAPYGAA